MTTTDLDRRSWTTPGAQDAAARTYASVQTAIERSPELTSLDIEVFLQGSYANSTNTRGDSDVDVVVMMKSTFMPDVSLLDLQSRQNWESDRVPGTTSAHNLRAAVTRAMMSYYGSSRVEERNKCIRIAKTEGYVDADVVPCLQHRRYTSYPKYGAPTWVEGIDITPRSGSRIVNFPKEHIANGKAKNARAGDYKATVRQVKRLRRAAVDAGLLSTTVAPGYLLECMTFNAPDGLFVSDDSKRLMQVVAWLTSQSADDMRRTFWSGDKINHLFVDDPGQFSAATAKQIAEVLWDFV
jgi:hypothetical protein